MFSIGDPPSPCRRVFNVGGLRRLAAESVEHREKAMTPLQGTGRGCIGGGQLGTGTGSDRSALAHGRHVMNRARCSAALYLICCTETYCSKYRKLRSSTQIIVMHRNARTHYNGIAMVKEVGIVGVLVVFSKWNRGSNQQATCEYTAFLAVAGSTP